MKKKPNDNNCNEFQKISEMSENVQRNESLETELIEGDQTVNQLDTQHPVRNPSPHKMYAYHKQARY